MYQSARKYAEQLGLENRPIGTYNGAAIWEFPAGQLLAHEPLPMEACKRLAAYCENRGLHLNAYMNDELYVASLNEKARLYMAGAGVQAHPVGSIFMWLTGPCTKMLIIEDPAAIQGLNAEVSQLMGPSFHVVQSASNYLEITSERATKGDALAWIANSMGIPRDSVLAIGDAANDIAMFQWAGTSFAMEHAADAVKRAATHVTHGAPGHGIAEAFERMGLI